MAQAPVRFLPPPVLHAVPIQSLRGEDEQDTALLQEMADAAVRYIRDFPWCVELHEQYFADGIGGVVALFLFRTSVEGLPAPEWLWVIVGDLPPTYFAFRGFPTPRSALLLYIEGVEEWLATAPEQRNSEELIPIFVPKGSEYIEMLYERISRLRTSILMHIRDT